MVHKAMAQSPAVIESIRKRQGAAQPVDIVESGWIRESQRLPIPNAVKIEVEGYEYFVLKG